MWPLVLAIAACASFAHAGVDDDCLACMCFVSSSGCQMPDPVCEDTDWGEVCGPWAITNPYWIDGGFQGGTFQNCVQSWECNESTVRAYLARYVRDPKATCETYARTHVGGPSGPSLDYTLTYWYQVKTCLDYGLFTPPSVEE
ncbi:lysozyme-like [Macrobrachium rosenbergii]|uniref:lysozyme-like n=1 Tax=Macrobrachium rosenbergii TaxID=79674 RepID=UPI0034D3E386